MGIASTVGDALSLERVRFQVLRHPPSFCSVQSARAARVRLDRLAKAVLLKDFVGGLLTVLPASRRLDIARLDRLLHRRLQLADEIELDESFYDCHLGAVPPLGPWYRIPTVVDVALLAQPEVYFEAGDHETLIRVQQAEFRRLLEGAEYLDVSNVLGEERSPAVRDKPSTHGTH